MEKISIPQVLKSNMDTNNIAIAYIRVSTKEQEEKGYSPEFQKEKAIQYASDNDLILTEDMIFEEAKPASKTSKDYDINTSLKARPLLQEIISMAQRKKFNHLIIYSRDRLSRNTEEYLALKTILAKEKITIHYSKPGETLTGEDDKINRFLEIVLASLAEFEANTLSLRVKGGASTSVKKGFWPGGRAPYGYTKYTVKIDLKGTDKTVEKKKIKSAHYERNIVQEIFNYYTQNGFGYRKIANELNIKYETNIWNKSNVESILKNETYTGSIAWDRRGGRRNPGKHKSFVQSPFAKEICIIDKDQWNNVLSLRNKKLNIKNPKYYSTPFILSEKLICENCGTHMNAKNYGKNKKSVYRCPTKNNNGVSHFILEKNFIEKKIINELIYTFNSQKFDDLWKIYNEEIENQNSKNKLLMEDLREKIKNKETVKNDIEKVFESNPDDKLKHALQSLYIVLDKEYCIYKNNLMNLELKINNKFSSIEDLKNKVNDICINFNKLDNSKKRMFIDLLIDKILVSENDTGDLSIKIVINYSKDLFSIS